ncbi:unnamed protein product [Phytophthora lilii]|uniref:Unnamed protein product n=1 Tax=Phytophthora lilii TaxID=2077276 RepID=A0A9W7CJ59_9STRA|nr:unnamed protein product [Phytophthora lilii]
MEGLTFRQRYDSTEVDSTALVWQEQVRRGLVSDDVRLRLETYSTLSAKCSESKEVQKQVGQLFGGPRSGVVPRFAGSKMLNVVFDDLRSTDKTLRIAAARVLCLMVYENLTNQQLIIRSQDNVDEEQVGVTVGWVHAFSIPQSLRERYEAQCEERGMFTTPSGLVEFVSRLIKDNYAPVYSRIGRYYAGGCHEFLPLCWFHALVNDSSEAADVIDVPDPSENIMGFYLVPRQMQFPEQDDYFLQEILSSIRAESELSRLQQVHAAFQQVAFRAPAKAANAAALKTALEGIYNRMTIDLLSDDDDEKEEAFLGIQQHKKFLHWLEASPERLVTWNELLVWCCTDMNAEEMLKRFGADACRMVGDAFQKLALGSEEVLLHKNHTQRYVWEPSLIGAILDHPNLPDGLKANFRGTASGYVSRLNLSGKTNTILPSKMNTAVKASQLTNEVFERPWEYLLQLELTEIHPVSWSVFLSKWRQSTDAKSDEEDVHIYHQSEKRHHSVGEGANPSLLVARKNALVSLSHNHRIFHSFRDLNQLRQQLPLITNRQSEVNKEDFELTSITDRLRMKCQQFNEADERELVETRKIFRRLQQSSVNLDELTRKKIEEKREARQKAHEKAAEKRKIAEQAVIRRQQELELIKRDRQIKVQDRVRRREHRWQLLIEARQERHQRIQWWKQIQQEAEVARQEQFMQQQQHNRDAENRLLQSQHTGFHSQRSSSEPTVPRLSLPQPPPESPPRERQLSCPRGPLSARTATDPHIVRERAHVYGCAASKAFAARRPQTARADFFSGTRGRQSPRAIRQPARRVRPASAGGNVSSEFSSSSSPTNSSTNDPQAAGVANACETLVMTNAAHAVSQQIAVPPVTTPVPDEATVPPALIMAQYLALEKEQRFKLHERYCVNRVSHKLTFAVLQQLTHEMRQDTAWREFLKAAGGPPGINSSNRNKASEKRKSHT